jgi:hypothetical protein
VHGSSDQIDKDIKKLQGSNPKARAEAAEELGQFAASGNLDPSPDFSQAHC